MAQQADDVPSMCTLVAEPDSNSDEKGLNPSSDTLQFCDYLSICYEHIHYPLNPIFLTSKISELVSTAQRSYVN